MGPAIGGGNSGSTPGPSHGSLQLWRSPAPRIVGGEVASSLVSVEEETRPNGPAGIGHCMDLAHALRIGERYLQLVWGGRPTSVGSTIHAQGFVCSRAAHSLQYIESQPSSTQAMDVGVRTAEKSGRITQSLFLNYHVHRACFDSGTVDVLVIPGSKPRERGVDRVGRVGVEVCSSRE